MHAASLVTILVGSIYVFTMLIVVPWLLENSMSGLDPCDGWWDVERLIYEF